MPQTHKTEGYNKNLFLKIVFTALFAAFTAAGAFIAIPIGPVPIVLQNLFAVLAGLILGSLMGSASVALYLLAGILGLPVFAGGTGGIARFAGPTGGYLPGYLLAALTAGLIAGRPSNRARNIECVRVTNVTRPRPGNSPPPEMMKGRPRANTRTPIPRIIAAVIAGFLIIYVPGVIWLKASRNLSWARAFMIGFFPYIIGDVFKGIAAVLIAPRLRRTAADFLEPPLSERQRAPLQRSADSRYGGK